MKTKIIKGLILSLILVFAICGSYESFRKNGVIANKETKISQLQSEIDDLQVYKNFVDSLDSIANQKDIDKFNFVKERFMAFNPNLEDSTVSRFLEVCNHFELDSTEEMFNLFVHEIILESGAKQYKDGELVESYAGALGIGQIMPNTAFSFLKRVVDSTEMYNLDCDDFNWIHKDVGMYSPDSPNTRYKVESWLSNEDNNLALWGAIMRYSLDKNNNNVYHALISYNAGGGGLRSFINSGRDPITHSYIKGILRKENIVEDIIENA